VYHDKLCADMDRSCYKVNMAVSRKATAPHQANDCEIQRNIIKCPAMYLGVTSVELKMNSIIVRDVKV
jgi:hypothetical protein